MNLKHLLNTDDLASPLSEEQAQTVVRQLRDWSGMEIYPRSIAIAARALFA
ncbi:MAG: hypothetical protein GXP42_08070, partial [Chloroflexi bacterium]|nr:hypothetical protein [Chloroflexota bacterium]